MIKIINNWLKDDDLVLFLERHFTYKTPHHYIEYADSRNAPPNIFGKNTDQETDGQIFYSYDFNPSDPLIKFLVLKILFTIEEITGVKDLEPVRVHLTIQHPGQDIQVHQDDGYMTAVYTAAAPGGGTFDFTTPINEQKYKFEKNTLFVFDGKQRHRADSPKANRPRVLFVVKLEKIERFNKGKS